MLQDSDSVKQDPGSRHPALQAAARWLGLGLYLAVGFLYLASGLVAPPWAVAALWAVWLALLIAISRAWRPHPWLVLAAPGLAYLIWVGVVLAGDLLLGWTA